MSSNFKPDRLIMDMHAPVSGEIDVSAVTTSASAAIDITGFVGKLVRLISDVGIYFMAGNQASFTGTPDETAVTGANQCDYLPAGQPYYWIVEDAVTDAIKHKGIAAGKCRVSVVSG